MDMGPYYLTMMVNLMGPVRRVQAVATSGQAERLITAAGPKQGTAFKVGTPTSVLSLLEFDCGATVTFGASWDVFRHSNHPIELHGTEGSLRLPDPDNFGGVRRALRPRRRLAGDGHLRLLYGAVNWPIGCAGSGQLPDAWPCRSRPRNDRRAVRRARRAIWRCTCSRSWKRSCAPAKPVSRRPFRGLSRSRGNCGKTKRGVCWHDTIG